MANVDPIVLSAINSKSGERARPHRSTAPRPLLPLDSFTSQGGHEVQASPKGGTEKPLADVAAVPRAFSLGVDSFVPQEARLPEQRLSRNGIIIVSGKNAAEASGGVRDLGVQAKAPGASLGRQQLPSGLQGYLNGLGGVSLPGANLGNGLGGIHLPGVNLGGGIKLPDASVPGGRGGINLPNGPGGGRGVNLGNFGRGGAMGHGDASMGGMGMGGGSGLQIGGNLPGPSNGPRVKFKGMDSMQAVVPGSGRISNSGKGGNVSGGNYGDEGAALGNAVGGAIGSKAGGAAEGILSTGFENIGREIGSTISKHEAHEGNDGHLYVDGQKVQPAGGSEQGSATTGGQSAGTTGGYSSDPKTSGPNSTQDTTNQSKKPAAQPNSSQPTQPTQTTDPKQSKKPESQPSSSGGPKPNGSLPADTGSSPVSPRANPAMPADGGSSPVSPRSNIANRFMPTDEGGGGSPVSNTFRPADDTAGGGDPRSNKASFASPIATPTVSAVSLEALQAFAIRR